MGSVGAFIKLFSQPTSPAEFVDRPPTYLEQINLRALAEAERRKQDETGPSFRTVDPMADYEESQRVGAFNALQNIPNSPLGGAVALIPGAYEGLTRPVEGANPEVPNMLAAVDQMSLGGLIEGNVLGGVMRTKPAEPVGPPARLRGQPTLGGLATADPFYSQLRTVLEDPKTQGTQTGEAWSRFLSDPKRGVKAEEMQYTGLRDLLKAKAGERVTKEEITSHLDANEIEIKEVTKGKKNKRVTIPGAEGTFRADMSDTKFSQHTLPGAENYREVLLTMAGSKTPVTVSETPDGTGRFIARLGDTGIGRLGDTPEAARQALNTYMTARSTAPEEFHGGHWEEGNVLAHLRLSDRTVGGKRTLLVEEIQSDWAQKGRKEGFGSADVSKWKATELPAGGGRGPGRFFDVHNQNGQLMESAIQAQDQNQAIGTVFARELRGGRGSAGVPQGPFVTDTGKWTALGLKRVLKMAADEGYDSIGIVPGVEQAKRYDLSKQVDKVYAEKKADGTYDLHALVPERGGMVEIGKSIPEGKIADNVGKDLAEKIIKQGGGRFEGVDLQVGGEGMKGYYDKIVPETLNKLAKEYGVKVQIEGGSVKTGGVADVKYTYTGPSFTLETLPRIERGGPLTLGFNAYLQKQLNDIKSQMRNEGVSFEEAMQQYGSIELAEKLGGKMRVENLDIKTPVHTLEVPEHMKKAIKSKGFPLYSSLQGKTLGDLANA